MKRRKTLFIGAIVGAGILLLAGCSAPSPPEETPDPAKAATPKPKDPDAKPPAPDMLDPKAMRKMKANGGGLPPK